MRKDYPTESDLGKYPFYRVYEIQKLSVFNSKLNRFKFLGIERKERIHPESFIFNGESYRVISSDRHWVDSRNEFYGEVIVVPYLSKLRVSA